MNKLDHPAKLAARARHWRLMGKPEVAEPIEAALAAAGKCKRCGRTLTDPVSVERGIGPECASRVSAE